MNVHVSRIYGEYTLAANAVEDRKERPFLCVHCNATFTRKDLLKRHLSRNHPELATTAPSAANEDPANEATALSMPGVSAETVLDVSPGDTTASRTSACSQVRQVDSAVRERSENANGLHEGGFEATTDPRMDINSSLDVLDFEALMTEMNENPLLLQTPSALMRAPDDASGLLQFNFDSPLPDQLQSNIAPAVQHQVHESTVTTSLPHSNAKVARQGPVFPGYHLEWESTTDRFSISEEKRILILEDTEAIFSHVRYQETTTEYSDQHFRRESQTLSVCRPVWLLSGTLLSSSMPS